METVPCIIADDLTNEQIKAFRLADNKVAELAEWDFAKLDEELATLCEFGMERFGFEPLEFEEEQTIEEDEVPEVDEESEPITKLGDIWQLGRHRLLCGDSTEAETIKAFLKEEKADLFITDPPYNVDYQGAAGKIQNDSMADETFKAFLTDAFASADGVMKAGAVFYIWHADSEGYNFRGACGSVEWKVRQCLIWAKNSFVLGRQDYHWKHEPCLYGWKDGASHYWGNDRAQTTILEFDRPTKSVEHPTMKPVQLFAYQICNSSKKNDVVLDLFAGSGTTIIACEQTQRNARCVELDPKFCDVIIKRWETLTGEKAVLINGNDGRETKKTL